MNLTKNFTLSEMTKSETALRHDMDNSPDQTAISNLQVLAVHVLQPVRDHYGKGVKVNSGFRHPDVTPRWAAPKHLTIARAWQRTSKSPVYPTQNWPSGFAAIFHLLR
jgi:hypothetical protein